MPVNQQPNQNQGKDATKKPPMRPDEYRPGDLPNEPYRDVPRAEDKVGKEHMKKDAKSSGSDQTKKSDQSCDSTRKSGGKDSGCC